MVDAELYARYQTALSTVGELSSDSVKKLLAQLDGMTEAEQAAYLLAYYPELAREYSALSSDVARQYYQDARDAEGLSSEYLAQEASPVPEEWLQGDVADAFLGNAGMMPAKLPGKAAKRAMQSAERTIVHNCQRDPAHPRWAFVPNVMACPWCIMIGSNGFVFRSQQTASAERHLHCTCAVVADFDTDNPALEGYDPKGMYDRMMECADAAGKPGDWDAALSEAGKRNREWLRTGEHPLDDEYHLFELIERDAAKPFGSDGAKQLADRMGACMGVRKDSFLHGEGGITQKRYDALIESFISDIGKAYGMNLSGEFACGKGLTSAMPDGYELWATTRMNGIFTTAQFLSEDFARGKANPDLMVDGQYIDIKSPNTKAQVKNRLGDAARQCINRAEIEQSGQSEGLAILSGIRIADDTDDKVFEYAKGRVDKTQSIYHLAKVWYLRSDSSIQEYPSDK